MVIENTMSCPRPASFGGPPSPAISFLVGHGVAPGQVLHASANRCERLKAVIFQDVQ